MQPLDRAANNRSLSATVSIFHSGAAKQIICKERKVVVVQQAGCNALLMPEVASGCDMCTPGAARTGPQYRPGKRTLLALGPQSRVGGVKNLRLQNGEIVFSEGVR